MCATCFHIKAQIIVNKCLSVSLCFCFSSQVVSFDDKKAYQRLHRHNVLAELKVSLSFMLSAFTFCLSNVIPGSHIIHSAYSQLTVTLESAAAGCLCLCGVRSTSIRTVLSVPVCAAVWCHHCAPNSTFFSTLSPV